MEKIAVAVINYKGGVGKTTLATILAQMSLVKRRKVLAIDLDPQENFKFALSKDLFQTAYKNVLQIKTSVEPSDAKSDVDWIILDCPPVLGEVTNDALRFADIALIPVQADIFSLNNLEKLYAFAEKIGLDKNQLPIVKVGYGSTALSRKLEAIIAAGGYPVAGQVPINRLIPYNIEAGRIWGTGFSADARRPYECLYERIVNAYQKMLSRIFDNVWDDGVEALEQKVTL